MNAAISFSPVSLRRRLHAAPSRRRSVFPHVGSAGRRVLAGLACFIATLFPGCAAAPDAVIEDDIDAFTLGIDGILTVGMPIKEARQALRERMPPASIDTQVPAPVPSANRSMQMRRYMVGWPTLSTGTTFIVTLFCDRDGKVVRWTTGPMLENQ